MTDSKTGSAGYADQFKRLRSGESDEAFVVSHSSSSYSDRYLREASENHARPAPGFRSYADQAASMRDRIAPAASPRAPAPRGSASAHARSPEPVTADAVTAGKESVSSSSTAETVNVEPKPTPKPLKQLVARGQIVGFTNKVKKQLARSERELGMVEGNLSSAGKDFTSLYITSCFDGDGKTISALYFAYGLASHGERVLLIDSNVAKPSMQRYFQTHGPGLAEIIAGTVPVELALHPTHHKGLEYIAAGTLPVGAHISSKAMKELLDLLKGYYRYIVIDGSSVFSSSEATRMASAVDGMVLVVACEQTRWEVAQSAEEKVTSAGGKVIGMSMNRRKFYLPRRIYDWLSG